MAFRPDLEELRRLVAATDGPEWDRSPAKQLQSLLKATPEALSPVLERAALSGSLAPASLLPVGTRLSDAERTRLLSDLAPHFIIEAGNEEARWRLMRDERTEILSRLVVQQRLATTLEAPLPPTDEFGERLRDVLNHGDKLQLEHLDGQALVTVAAALGELGNVDVPKPDSDKLNQLIARQHFQGNNAVLLEKGLVGRQRELAQLNEFLVPDANRFWQGLIVTGLGGAGKSTLLAKFAQDVLEHKHATVVMLDFDRPGITPHDPHRLEMELTRQVGIQHPELYPVLKAARVHARELRSHQTRMKASSSERKEHDRQRALIGRVREGLVSVQMAQKPLLLLLDTIEQVTQPRLEGKLIAWLHEVAESLQPTRLHVVLSGRVFESAALAIHNVQPKRLEIEELEPQFAERLLVLHQVPPATAKRAAQSSVLPRRPLELLLMAKLLQGVGPEAVRELELELKRGGPKAKDLFASLVYNRVLKRLGPEGDLTRKLASPGLVLRYVTVELLQRVLAPCLDLGEMTEGVARSALDRLVSFGWIVSREGDAVWHRRDLRRSMLKATIAAEREKAEKIAKAAIAYFEARSDPRERAEATYHRLMLCESGPDSAHFELTTLKSAVTALLPDIEDLPPTGAALLRHAAGSELSPEELALLPQPHIEAAYDSKGKSCIASRQFGTALELMRLVAARGARLRNLPLDEWEVETLFATATWDSLSAPLNRSGGLRHLVSHVFPAGLVAPERVSPEQLSAFMSLPFENARPRDSDTLWARLAFGLLLVDSRTPLPPDARDFVRRAYADLAPRLTGGSPAARRMRLLGVIAGDPTAWRELARHAPLPLDPSELSNHARRLDRGDPTAGRIRSLLAVLNEGARGRKQAAAILSELGLLFSLEGPDELPTLDLLQGRAAGSERELIAYEAMLGPVPELRDPIRFALLDAFQGEGALEALRGTLRSAIPIELDELSAPEFSKAILANSEHFLEGLVEFADRAGAIEKLLALALEQRPLATKLRRVHDAHQRWRRVLRATLARAIEGDARRSIQSGGVQFTGLTRPGEASTEKGARMTANLGRKAKLDSMVRLVSQAESLEKAGKEPTTTADEFEDRQGYNQDFLDGWQIKLPRPMGAAAADVRKLRRGGTGDVLKYEHFSVIMSASRRLPLITAANIDGNEGRKVPRISTWSFDGRLDKEDQWGDALYDRNELDRGHMVRREDPIWGPLARAKIANADTFHFTNSCPQMAGVNQRTWLGLENYMLQHARADKMRVSVFTGPFFGESDVAYRGALVPLAFWKVIAIVTEDGRPSATAYKVSQSKELEELEFVYAGYKTFQISIQQVIDATNIDFSELAEYDGFTEFERAHKTRLEEVVEGPESIRI